MSRFIDMAQVLTGQRRKRLGFRSLLIPSLCGFVLLRLERLLPPRREALLRLVRHLKQKHSLRFSPVSGHLLLRAMIKLLLESSRERILREVGASQARLTRAKRRPLRTQRLIYISILESFVKRFYGNSSKMYY